MIELQDVCGCLEANRRFPVASLDGVNLCIEGGEWLWLVGPAGAGKSSLLRLLCAESRAHRGQVVASNRDLATLNALEIARLRRNIGVVPTDLALIDEMSALQNVAFALQVTGTSIKGVNRFAPAALERVGLTTRSAIRARDLSPLERVKLALARALASDPALLLVDDATQGLEAEDSLQIGQLLQDFYNEHGPTVVMATGARKLVDTFRHRVVRFREGRIVSDHNPGTFGSDDLFEGAKRAWVAERIKGAKVAK